MDTFSVENPQIGSFFILLREGREPISHLTFTQNDKISYTAASGKKEITISHRLDYYEDDSNNYIVMKVLPVITDL